MISEKRKESKRKWMAANAARVKECQRRWNAIHRANATYREKRSAYTTAWRRANPQKAHETSRRSHLKLYGVSPEGYAAILESQGGKCAICGAKPGKKRLSVDHCHATGVVRGLLCHHCNTTIGKHFDSPDALRAILRYVEKHSQLRLVVRR